MKKQQANKNDQNQQILLYHPFFKELTKELLQKLFKIDV